MPRSSMTAEQKKAFAEKMKLARSKPKSEKEPKTKSTSESDGYITIAVHKKGQPVKKYKEIIPKGSASMQVPI